MYMKPCPDAIWESTSVIGPLYRVVPVAYSAMTTLVRTFAACHESIPVIRSGTSVKHETRVNDEHSTHLEGQMGAIRSQ
jgi:hypothetical protein